jgi:hypothetical protein
MTAVLLFASAMLLPQESSEAEALLQKVERALASNLSLKFKTQVELREYRTVKPAGGRVRAQVGSVTLELRPGHRVDIQARLSIDGLAWPEPMPKPIPGHPERPQAWMSVKSDGSTLTVSPLEKPAVARMDAPPRLNSTLVRQLLRIGVMSTVEETVRKVALQDGIITTEAVLGLKILGQEKVGEVEAIKLQIASPKPNPAVSLLWIDAKTHLPLKRETRSQGATWERTTTETYSGFGHVIGK